jgi:hypothetical protein
MNSMKMFGTRIAAATLLASNLLVPTVSAEPEVTGTLVGVVTCGFGQSAAPSLEVSLEGGDLSTHSGEGGHFTLVGVPAAEIITVNAVGDANLGQFGSRPNVEVGAGETLDIGQIDVGTCPMAEAETMAPGENSQNDNRESSNSD